MKFLIKNLLIVIVILMVNSLFSCKNKDAQNMEPEISYYKEQYRNQYHFSPEANWMNDPNGMVYLDGEYHLFYQYYPDSTVWGPMHWAHSVSKDLIHWKHLPIALYPDSLGYIFSGSAVIDHQNTAGFGKDALVAIFTYHDIKGEQSGTSITFQYQGIAYSLDKGRTFTKYEGNPVIPNPGIKDFRDPKVIWDEANNQWVLVLAAYDKAIFYVSPDLKSWRKTSEFGIDGDTRLWECPDLFPIKVKGTDELKWVLITSIQKEGPNGGTATSYFIGEWDGERFVGDNSKQQWLDYGTDNYAAVSWSNAPSPDDEKLIIGWMSNWQYAQIVPSEKWRSAMTLPRVITLHNEGGEYQLRSKPVDKINSLIESTDSILPVVYRNHSELLDNLNGTSQINMKVEILGDNVIEFKLSNALGEYTLVGYDPVLQHYFIDRSKSGTVDFFPDFPGMHTAQASYVKSEVDMTIFLDHASIELFADDGRTVMTDIIFPTEPYNKLEIVTNNQEMKIMKGSI
jgi:fructan beta-fructosidase